MKKIKKILDYIIIFILALAFLIFFRCSSINYNSSLIFFSVQAFMIVFLLLIPLSRVFMDLKEGTFTIYLKLSFIVRGTISAIICVFLYDFIIYDYTYWISNKNFLSQLAIFSLAIIVFYYIVELIKQLKVNRKNISILRIIGSSLLIFINLYLFILPILNTYSPKKDITLPIIRQPKSITLTLKNPNNNNTLSQVVIADSEAIKYICNAFSNCTVENLRNLDSIKFSMEKMSNPYYELSLNYDSYPFSFKDLQNGYLPTIEMLPGGYVSISVFNDSTYQDSPPYPLISPRYNDTYTIKLPDKVVNYLIKQIRK